MKKLFLFVGLQAIIVCFSGCVVKEEHPYHHHHHDAVIIEERAPVVEVR